MDCITFSYLKPKVGSGNILEANNERSQGIDNIELADIIDGPLEVRATKKVTMVTGTCDQVQQGNLFEVNGYDQGKRHFEVVKKMERAK